MNTNRFNFIQTTVLLLCVLLSSLLSAQTYFEDVALAKGINHTFNESVPGIGVSFCDFNLDGQDDLTLATADGELLRFFINNNGNFEEIPALVDHQEHAKQILWVDFDNDGDKDLYVATYDGLDRLYQNNGNLNFQDITFSSGLSLDSQRTFGACWADYNRDGWLDLYYSERKFPLGISLNENRLFRNNGDGTFTEVTTVAQVADEGRIPFCAAFLDYNNDKWPDIYIANDKASVNTLLQNNGDGTYSDVGAASNANLSMDAMCVAVGDYDNDGWQDIYITNIETGNKLLRNMGANNPEAPVFEEVADVTGTAFYSIGWGANFLDANNDGNLDLYVSGMVSGSDVTSSAYYENLGDGSFFEPNAGFIGDTVVSFSNAIGDFNMDGAPDIMVTNQAPYKSQLWENGGSSNNWLKIKLQGVLSNRDAIGSKIEVYANDQYFMRYTHCGIGFLGQNSETEIFGLGTLEAIDSLVVTWPTGHIDVLTNLSANANYFLEEGSTTNGEIEVDPDINLLVNTQDIELQKPLIVYPNPTHEFIQIDQYEKSFKTYYILNTEGQFIQSGAYESQIAVQRLPSGMYYVVLLDQEGDKYLQKFEKF